MNPGDETNQSAESVSSSEVERLLASVMNPQPVASAVPEPPKDGVRPYDFRNPMLLGPAELRKLRLHQQEFAEALAARMSLYLRLEFTLKLTSLQTVAYGKVAQSWRNPSHLTLFKIEPLRGVSILEIPPQLGLSMVDRLMGGRGEPPDSIREMSEIENALLDQAVHLILGEWCAHWNRIKELKPVLLGSETNGKFIQTAPPETMMLVVAMEARFGNCTEQIQIGFPYASLESFIRQLARSASVSVAEAPAQPAPKPACKWNPCFDDVCVPVTAEWDGVEMTARAVLALKVGDVIKLDPESVHHVKVRLAEHYKFQARLGSVGGNWAVELTQPFKRTSPNS